MFPFRVVERYIPIENVRLLPEGKAVFLSAKKKGLAKVQIDFHWIRNNTFAYEKLMGRR